MFSKLIIIICNVLEMNLYTSHIKFYSESYLFMF